MEIAPRIARHIGCIVLLLAGTLVSTRAQTPTPVPLEKRVDRTVLAACPQVLDDIVYAANLRGIEYEQGGEARANAYRRLVQTIYKVAEKHIPRGSKPEDPVPPGGCDPVAAEIAAFEAFKPTLREAYRNDIAYWVRRAESKSHFAPPAYELSRVKQLAETYFPRERLETFFPERDSIAEWTRRGAERAHERGSSCTPVDLRRGALAAEHMRTQDGAGWCYAFAAADLLSDAFREELKGERISAAAAASAYLGDRNLAAKEVGGYPIAVERLVIERGACLERDLPSETRKTASDWRQLITVIDELLALKKRVDQDLAPRLAAQRLNAWESLVSLFSSDAERTYRYERLGDALAGISPAQEAEACQMVARIEDNLGWKMNGKAFLRVLAYEKEEEVLQALTKLACSKPFVPKRKYEAHAEIYLGRTGAGVRRIDELMNAGYPVQVDLYASMLTDPYRGELKDPHGVIAVGRKYNAETKTCEYLLRNSWGTDCEQFQFTAVRCEKGQLWISEADLAHAMTQITWITREEKAR